MKAVVNRMYEIMNMQRSAISPIDFLLWILGVSAGLIVLANLVASGLSLHVGMVLFILGIVAMFIGNLLGLPARRYERRCGIKHINLFQLPAPEEYIAEKMFSARNTTSFYSLENAVLLGGIVILAIGLILLF